MQMLYCPVCGTLLDEKEVSDEGNVPWCPNCQEPRFKIAYPCVILLVENENKEICIIEQSYGTIKPVLVAGFIKYGQTAEETIKAEIFEEIGHEVIDFTYINSYFQANRGNLMLGYVCHVKKKDFVLSNELSNARWASVSSAKDLLKNSPMALKLLNDYLKTEVNK